MDTPMEDVVFAVTGLNGEEEDVDDTRSQYSNFEDEFLDRCKVDDDLVLLDVPLDPPQQQHLSSVPSSSSSSSSSQQLVCFLNDLHYNNESNIMSLTGRTDKDGGYQSYCLNVTGMKHSICVTRVDKMKITDQEMDLLITMLREEVKVAVYDIPRYTRKLDDARKAGTEADVEATWGEMVTTWTRGRGMDPRRYFKDEVEYIEIFVTVHEWIGVCQDVIYSDAFKAKSGYELECWKGRNISETSKFLRQSGLQTSCWFSVDKSLCAFAGTRDARSSADQSRCQIEATVSIEDLVFIPLADKSDIPQMVMAGFDIECLSDGSHFPQAEQDPVITISIVKHVTGTDKFEYVDLTTKPSWPLEGHKIETFSGQKGEEYMLRRFFKLMHDWDIDIINSHNGKTFDIPYMARRLRKLTSTQYYDPDSSYISCTLSKFQNYRGYIQKSTSQSKQRGAREIYTFRTPGIVHMDSCEVFRQDFGGQSSYALNSLALQYLKDKKADLSYAFIPILWKKDAGGVRSVISYCSKDALLSTRLLVEKNRIDAMVAMSRVCQALPNDHVYTKGLTHRMRVVLFNYNEDKGYLHPTPPKAKDNVEIKKFEGAEVIDPVVGIHVDNVGILDFTALYPSIMMGHNLCSSTHIGHKSEVTDTLLAAEGLTRDDLLFAPNGEVFVKHKVRVGSTPLVANQFLAKRKLVNAQLAVLQETECDPEKVRTTLEALRRDLAKKGPEGLNVANESIAALHAKIDALTKTNFQYQEQVVLDALQMALKLCANGTYGAMASAYCDIPRAQIGEAVTSNGKFIILSVKTYVEHMVQRADWTTIKRDPALLGSIFTLMKEELILRKQSGSTDAVNVQELIWTACVHECQAAVAANGVTGTDNTPSVTVLQQLVKHPEWLWMRENQRFWSYVVKALQAHSTAPFTEESVECIHKLWADHFASEKIAVDTNEWIYRYPHIKLQVIYGDTDSVMIKTVGNQDLEVTKYIMTQILVPDINVMFNKHIQIKLENIFSRFISIAKKKYIADCPKLVELDKRPYLKGVAAIRRETLPFTKRLMLGVIVRVMRTADMDEGWRLAIEFVEQELTKLYQNNIDFQELIVSKGYNKAIYDSPPAHIQLAERLAKIDPGSAPKMGDRISYVIVAGGTNEAGLGDKIMAPDQALANNAALDVKYYFEHMIKTPLHQLFELRYGARTETVVWGRINLLKVIPRHDQTVIAPQTTKRKRQERQGFSQTNKKQMSIAGFVSATGRCLNCRAPARDSICIACEGKRDEIVADYRAKLKYNMDIRTTQQATCAECVRRFLPIDDPMQCNNRACELFYARLNIAKKVTELTPVIDKLAF